LPAFSAGNSYCFLKAITNKNKAAVDDTQYAGLNYEGRRQIIEERREKKK